MSGCSLSTKQRLSDGQIKVYEYKTIKGVPVNDYMREYMRARKRLAPPTPKCKRLRKYQTLSDETKRRIFALHRLGIGKLKISKMVSPPNTKSGDGGYIAHDTIIHLLKDSHEREAFKNVSISKIECV